MRTSTLTKLKRAMSLLTEVIKEIEEDNIPNHEKIEEYKPGG